MDFRGWEAAWVLYTLLMPVSLYLWRRGSRLYFDGVIAMWAAIYVFVYSVTPLHLGYHMQTSVARLLSHFYPLVLFQLATLLALLLRSALYVNQQGNDTNVEAVMTFGDEEQEEQEEVLAVGAGPPALAGTAAATQVPHL